MKTSWLKQTTWLLILLWGSALVSCTQVYTETTYADVTYDQRVAQADLIVAGKITHISETLWNQDSGAYWEEKSADGSTVYTGVAYYTIDIEVSQSIVANAENKPVTLVVVGESILSSNDTPTNPLQVGSEVVMFAEEAGLAWRGGGTHPILELMGVPSESYLLKGADGLYHSANSAIPPSSLEDLIREIATKRTAGGA